MNGLDPGRVSHQHAREISNEDTFAYIRLLHVGPFLIKVKEGNAELFQFHVRAARGIDKAEPERQHIRGRDVERHAKDVEALPREAGVLHEATEHLVRANGVEEFHHVQLEHRGR